MKTYSSEGNNVTLTAPMGGVTVDVPVQIGSLVVVPTVTAAATERFVGFVKGVITGHKKTASQAWTEGQAIYWDAELEEFTSVAGDNHWVGVALEAAVSGAQAITTGKILFNGMLTAGDETT